MMNKTSWFQLSLGLFLITNVVLKHFKEGSKFVFQKLVIFRKDDKKNMGDLSQFDSFRAINMKQAA